MSLISAGMLFQTRYLATEKCLVITPGPETKYLVQVCYGETEPAATMNQCCHHDQCTCVSNVG